MPYKAENFEILQPPIASKTENPTTAAKLQKLTISQQDRCARALLGKQEINRKKTKLTMYKHYKEMGSNKIIDQFAEIVAFPN